MEELAGDSVEDHRLDSARANSTSCYRGARGFIYPSTFEGFGMPVLEAMAAGVPVACSDIPPLREIARPRSTYFDPRANREIRDALVLLAAGMIPTEAAQQRAPRVHLGENGARNARLSQQVFQLNLGIGLRIAILHDDRRVQRQAPVAARP